MLLLASGLGVYNFIVANTIEEKVTIVEKVTQEGKQLNENIKELNRRIDAFESNNEELSTKISALREEATALRDKIARLQAEKDKLSAQDYNSKIGPAQKEYQALKNKFNNLKKRRERLRASNDTLETDLSQRKDTLVRIDSARRQLQETINKRRQVKAYSIKVSPYTFNFFGKKKPTNSANKVYEFEVCFVLEQNPLGHKGKKPMYLRILDGSGKQLSDESTHLFRPEGAEQKYQYAVRKEVEYTGEEKEVCLTYALEDFVELTSGDFTFELYRGDELIGEETKKLK